MPPRAIHFVWLGGHPIPALFRTWIDQAGKLHPGWQVRVWNSLRGLELRPYAERCKTYSGQSDVVRFEVLRDYGGVYLDTDMCLIRNLEPAVDGARLALCNSANRGDQMATGFIAAEKHTPELIRVCEAVKDIDFDRPAFCGAQTGPGFFKRALGDLGSIDGLRVLENRAFYPVSFAQRATIKAELPRIAQEKPDGVYGIHAWDNSWSRANGFA